MRPLAASASILPEKFTQAVCVARTIAIVGPHGYSQIRSVSDVPRDHVRVQMPYVLAAGWLVRR